MRNSAAQFLLALAVPVVVTGGVRAQDMAPAMCYATEHCSAPMTDCTTDASWDGCGGASASFYAGTCHCGSGYATAECGNRSGHGRCGRCCRFAHLHSTFDLYPHYPYFPAHHGYYYYRPYNYVHVLEHQSSVIALGGDPRSPYSVRMFDAIERDFEQRHPQPIEPAARPVGESLPLLEDLLR